jgi:hypothetical protein
MGLGGLSSRAIADRAVSANTSSAGRKPNPLSYPKSAEAFSMELFKSPSKEYRGCPFWSWNTKLRKDQHLKQIDYFKEMGMGGFHMHVRVGLDTEYLGEEFMDMVRASVEYAEERDMLACLYVKTLGGS